MAIHCISKSLIPLRPLAAWFNAFLDLCFGRSVLARHIVAFLLIFLQASYLGIVFSSKKAFAENTYIPSLDICHLVHVLFRYYRIDPGTCRLGIPATCIE